MEADEGEVQSIMRMLAIDPGGAVEEDEVLAHELLDADPPSGGEGVPGVHDEHDLVLVERHALDVGMAERAHEAELHLVAQHHVQHLLGVPRADGQPDRRVRGAEALQDRREDVRADRGGRAEQELSGGAASEVRQQLATVGERHERALGVGQEGASGLREPHPAARPDEQRPAELPLQRLEARRQRRLADEQRLRRAADVAPPRDLEEALHLREQHRRLPPPIIQRTDRADQDKQSD